MAETPPQGSLLSNFLSGGNVGGSPFGSQPKSKTPYIDPNKLPPDQAARIGEKLTEVSVGTASAFFGGFKEELLGTGVLRRFGGEDKVVAAAYDYTKNATTQEDPELLKDLDLETPAKFEARYRPFMQAKQDEDNKDRREKGQPEIKGFGNYELGATGIAAPAAASASLAGQLASRQLEVQLKRIDQLSIDHPELSFFTKQEIAEYLPAFLKKTAEEKSTELSKTLASSAGMGGKALYNKLQTMLAQYEDDQRKPEQARTSTLHKIEKGVKEQIFSKSLLRRLPRIISELRKFSSNPAGSIWQRYAVGEGQIFGRKVGLGIGRRVSSWLAERGRIGRVVSYLYRTGLLNAPGDLFRKGLFNLGKLSARFGSRGSSFVVQASGRAAAWLAGAALGAVGGPILVTIGVVVVAVAFLAIMVLLVFVPFFMGFGGITAQAAPQDFTISAQANPAKDVGPNTPVQINIQLTANRDLTTVNLKVEFDNNFAPGTISFLQPDGTVEGLTATLPRSLIPVVTKGEQLSFSVTATTSSSMSTTTTALIAVSAFVKNALSVRTSVVLNSTSPCPASNTGCPYGWPTNGGISQGLHPDIYGCTSIFNCGTAVDIGVDGARVCSTMDGEVVRTDDGAGGLGPWIVNNSTGYFTIYNHMKAGSLAISPGDRVSRGQFLGLSDNSGITTGAHLHYAIFSSPNRKTAPGTDFYLYVPPGYLDNTGTLLNSNITDGIGC